MQPAYRSIPVVNITDATIPPRSIVALSEVKLLNGQAYAEASKPMAVWDQMLAVTDGIEIPAGQPGRALFTEQIVIVQYNTDATPAVGDVWGPYPDDFTLNSEGSGWYILRVDADNELVHAIRNVLFPIVKVQTDGDHDKDTSQNCKVLFGAKGSEEPIQVDEEDVVLECYNSFGDLADETVALAAYVSGGWELIAAGCE